MKWDSKESDRVMWKENERKRKGGREVERGTEKEREGGETAVS